MHGEPGSGLAGRHLEGTRSRPATSRVTSCLDRKVIAVAECELYLWPAVPVSVLRSLEACEMAR